MDTISLASYETEIDQLLEQKKYDDAIAHCSHILQSFPRNVNVLRLLGKAFLEKQEYLEACQNFLRVLSVTPTDFIAHIGMSVIREDEKLIDAAIWHMERAFEQQPVNPAIQDELRRLYSIKTQDEPVKMRLSRAALVRMYTRGKLHSQAIAEAEASLIEEPNRLDLQSTLAQLYFSTGRMEKSVTLSENILEKLPLNLIANQVMSTYLSDEGRYEEAEGYTRRCFDLDPVSTVQKKEGRPGEGGIPQSAAIEKLDNLSSQFTGEKTTSLNRLLDEFIPVDGIENWLNSVENYQKLMDPLPPEGASVTENLEKELLPVIDSPAEEEVAASEDFSNDQTAVTPGFVEEELGTQIENAETTDYFEEKIELMTGESGTSGLLAPSPDQNSLDNAEESVLLPEPILEETLGKETEPAAGGENTLDDLVFPVSTVEETNQDFEESLVFQKLEEVEDISLPAIGLGVETSMSENYPESGDQGLLKATTETNLQENSDTLESTEPLTLAEDLDKSTQTGLGDVNIEDGVRIEPGNLSDGWIPIGTSSTEVEERVLVDSTNTRDVPVDDFDSGQTPLADQVHHEPEELTIEETAPEMNTVEDVKISPDLEEEITKPIQVTPGDSSGGVQEVTTREISDVDSQKYDSEVSKLASQVEQGDQIEQETPEKKQGFLAWLKSVKSVVQEEIKEPKLPAWMQTGKPSERIKVPEISDILDLEKEKQEELAALPEIPQSIPVEEEIPAKDQDISVHQEEEQTLEVDVEAEAEQLSPPDTQEEEVWEVGYTGQEMVEEVEPASLEQPRYMEDLERARNDVNQGNYVKAAERYKKLIKRGINLNNIILSLEETVKIHPGEMKLLQILGDAYVRSGRLQDALDAYTKAEELLK